jgi:transposase
MQRTRHEAEGGPGSESELKSALEPLMSEVESVSERICEYDQLLESMVRNRYPEAERLKQILTYMLTLEDPHRKSRDAACYVGLQPGRRNSGLSEPQKHISKEGDPYLRALLVQAAHPGSHSTRRWSQDTEYPWSSGITHQPPSTCGSLQSGGWHTRPPIAVCSVQT